MYGLAAQRLHWLASCTEREFYAVGNLYLIALSEENRLSYLNAIDEGPILAAKIFNIISVVLPMDEGMLPAYSTIVQGNVAPIAASNCER